MEGKIEKKMFFSNLSKKKQTQYVKEKWKKIDIDRHKETWINWLFDRYGQTEVVQTNYHQWIDTKKTWHWLMNN